MLVDAKDNCILILTQFDPRRELHRIGKTKVNFFIFYRYVYIAIDIFLIVLSF